MIQQVGFRNFRRFEDFPAMELGNINIFVGRNNAGKSTVMKALQLIKGNLNTLSSVSDSENIFKPTAPVFVFDVDEMAELHIDNFERALYNKAKRKEITLSATINGCTITIVLDGQNVEQNNYFVAVPYNSIELEDDKLHLKFNFQTRDLELQTKAQNSKENIEDLDLLKKERDKIAEKYDHVMQQMRQIMIMSGSGSGEDDDKLRSEEMVKLVAERQNLEQSIRMYRHQLTNCNRLIAKQEKLLDPVSLTIEEMPEFIDDVNVNIIAHVFNNLSRYAEMSFGLDRRTTEYSKTREIQTKLREIGGELEDEKNRFLTAISNYEIEYIHAHAASQRVIYLKDDKNDALSRALSKFCKARIIQGSPEWTFVKKWMGAERFSIGDDFSIEDIQSAGYTLHIVEDGEMLNLADKGTGSIQLMTLLLTLATVMNRTRTEISTPTILIEEPEQNIHPMLQSMLADMFLDFWKNIKDLNKDCQLIIETHSEYLIRRTQVLVAEKNYADKDDLKENNPFKVIYFPSEKDKQPYVMEYQADGKFANDFGKGFFDEAENLAFAIL